MSVVELRPVTADDEPLLYRLFLSGRPELALLPEPLIRMQYMAQRSAYEAQYPGSSYEVVLHQHREVGRLWVARSENELRLVDIALLPEARNAGIGTCLMKGIQAEAQAAGKPIRSSVMRLNPGSLRFHQRHGFAVVGNDEIQVDLEWRPKLS